MRKIFLYFLMICLSCGCSLFQSRDVSKTASFPEQVGAPSEPFVYLTWQLDDTSHEMTVHYQTATKPEAVNIYYDTVGRNAKTNQYANRKKMSYFMKGTSRHVHTARLTGLRPDTTYYFIVGNKKAGYVSEKKFRTLPDDDQPLRFATCGDMDSTNVAKRLLKQSAALGPSVFIVGGDIAYAHGRVKHAHRWDRWLRTWQNEMVTPDGHMIPMILAIGNHEVKGSYKQPKEHAPYYFSYFDQGGETYFTRRLGKNILFIILDSGHINSHRSQTAWLDEVLSKYKDIPYKFVIYHVPLYPSHRHYGVKYARKGRKYWLPIFDKHHITVAFENHDHTFKRSKRLYNGEVVDLGEGTIYLGDGNCGRTPAIPKPGLWYVEKTSDEPHVWIGDITKERAEFRAINERGDAIDQFLLP